jgi:hypothetical protein
VLTKSHMMQPLAYVSFLTGLSWYLMAFTFIDMCAVPFVLLNLIMPLLCIFVPCFWLRDKAACIFCFVFLNLYLSCASYAVRFVVLILSLYVSWNSCNIDMWLQQYDSCGAQYLVSSYCLAALQKELKWVAILGLVHRRCWRGVGWG